MDRCNLFTQITSYLQNHSKTMRKFAFVTSFVFVWLSLQPLWAQLTETRDLPTFQAVKNMGSMHVILQKGDKESVRIESEKAPLDEIITEISDGELKVHFKEHVRAVIGYQNFVGRGRVTVYVTFKQLAGIRNSGSGSIECQDMIQAPNFDLKQSGSGVIKIGELDIAQNVSAKVSGSGKLYVKTIKAGGASVLYMSGSGKMEIVGGATRTLEAKVSGSGVIDCAEMSAENAEVKVSGSGKLRLYVENHLEAKISGSGSILYREKPQTVNADVSGSGRVKAIENK
jgi:Putative auto-transporter adhesin, head GIN domain